MQVERNHRILLIDDNPAIHDDFKKILLGQGAGGAEVDELLNDFLGADGKATTPSAGVEDLPPYEISSAMQGEEAFKLVQEARQKGLPFALAFVDVRMPPGWDGVVTLRHLFEVDPELQAVICTAYSDYSYADMLRMLGHSDRLLILKKPFDPIEVQQLASALLEKWHVSRCNRYNLEEVRAYAASLETVNRALASDKAMAEAFSQNKTDFIVKAGKLIGGGAAEIARRISEARELIGTGSGEATELDALVPQAHGLEQLIEEVLCLAELDAGRACAQAKACQLDGLLSEAHARWVTAAEARGKRLQFKPLGPLPRNTVLDPKHVRSLLDNLIAGVLDLEPGPVVDLSLGLENKNQMLGSKLRMELRLPGLDLGPDGLQSFFEPFSMSGDRLNLALAKGEARLLKAELFVEGLGQAGTRIVLRLDPGIASGVEMFELRTQAA